jgi:cytochrome c6
MNIPFDRFRNLTAPAIFAAIVLGLAPAAASDKAGPSDKVTSTYKGNCAACHGSDGAGTPLGKTMQAPDLRSEPVQKKSDGELAQAISEGKNNMPAFKNTLTGEQIETMVAYIRALAKNQQSSQK